MGEQYQQKISYSYAFKENEVAPLLETQVLLKKDDMFLQFGGKELSEPLQRKTKDEAVSLAEVQDDVSEIVGSVSANTSSSTEKEQGEDKKYALTYYNPESGKSEVLAITTSVKIKDYIKKAVEESVGMQSTYPIYSYITTPIIRKEMNPYVLQEIKDNTEYDVPPKFGGGVRVKLAPAKSEIVVADQKEAIRDAVIDSVKRKELAEKKVDEEIVVLEHAVEQIRAKEPSSRVVDNLPALSRARFQVLLKKKRISESALVSLLEKDISFLKSMRGKLKSLSTKDLLEIAKSIKLLKMK
jgi:hypothetical protein